MQITAPSGQKAQAQACAALADVSFAIIRAVGAWRSLVAHLHGVQGVASSNLVAPTSNTKGFRLIAGNPFHYRRDLGAREQLQAIGSDWTRRGSSAVLVVPSSVIPAETNCLLNPVHPSFAKIGLGERQDFVTDLPLIQ